MTAGPVDTHLIAAGVLAATAVLALVRTARRLGTWRHALVWLQPVAALLLYGVLVPPELPRRADTLTVWTAGAAPNRWRVLLWPQHEVALPEADVDAAIERVPDLATALRRYPATTALHIEGDGLPPRDLDIARGLAVDFTPPPEHGLLTLHAPDAVQAGTAWQVDGRVAAPAAHVELRDPAGAVVDSADAPQGRYALTGTARAAGDVVFDLRVLDAHRQVIDHASVPLHVRSGQPRTAIVRAGTPDPELKYWRRWAADAGITVRLQAGLSDGLVLRDGDASLSPQALATADLLLIDERAWAGLTPAEVAAVRNAVEQGLGVLLRLTGVPDARVVADWRELGWRLEAANAAASAPAPKNVTLDRRTGLRASANEHTEFTAAPVRADAADAVPLLIADDGTVLASVRDMGAGRVGVWGLIDTYRMTLAGEAAHSATLWADAFAVVSRSAEREVSGSAAAVLDPVWERERMTRCATNQRSKSTAVPKNSGPTHNVRLAETRPCAALWPAQPGWTGASAEYVRDRLDGRGLRAHRDRKATFGQQRGDQIDQPVVQTDVAAPYWTIFSIWLAFFGGMIFIERRESDR